MNNSLTRKLCESRHRWPIVATATVVVALATLVPAVDDYFTKRSSRNDLAAQLDQANLAAEGLPRYEARAQDVRDQLQALEARAIDDDRLANFRSRLVDVIRDSGCQIRRIEVGTTTTRPWTDKDNPLDEQSREDADATPFSLQRRSIVLAVDGSMPAVQDLLKRLEEEQTLSHPHRVHLHALSGGGETITLELELWLFALARTAA